MIVEIVGSTGAGKSTVARRLLELLNARGHRAFLLADGWRWSSDEAVRRYHGLSLRWLRSPLAMSVVMDVLAYPWFVRFLWQRPGLSLLMARSVCRDTSSPGLTLNALRNVAKHVGIRELLGRRAGTDGPIVILDEGVVHQAHNLFVHPQTEPKWCEVERFTAEIPVPDLLVLVEAPTSSVLRRTIQRSHVRIRGRNRDRALAFVTHAQQVFRTVCELAALRTDTAVVRNFGDAKSLDAALEDILMRMSLGSQAKQAAVA